MRQPKFNRGDRSRNGRLFGARNGLDGREQQIVICIERLDRSRTPRERLRDLLGASRPISFLSVVGQRLANELRPPAWSWSPCCSALRVNRRSRLVNEQAIELAHPQRLARRSMQVLNRP